MNIDIGCINMIINKEKQGYYSRVIKKFFKHKDFSMMYGYV